MMHAKLKYLGLLLGGLAIAYHFHDSSINSSPDPNRVLQSMYETLYQDGSTASSLDKPDSYYAAALSKAIGEEQIKQRTTGELGKLSADPLCNCQDPSAVKVLSVQANELGAHQAEATVVLSVSGSQEVIQLKLRREEGLWKVEDVLSRDLPKLSQLLAEDRPNP
ncbi:MAG TPA: DUF3828 domain-containing protein [Limnobacter sp.]|nr:DUF3828 domain-containing protein [Limnobacter sp.]